MSTLLEKDVVSFTLILSGVDEHTPDLEDALYKSGCDNALISFNAGTVYLDFDVDSDDIETDIIDAICRIEQAGIGAIVESAAPAPYVSLSDIAKRLKKTRQGISLLAAGKRGDGTFPKPLFKIDDKSPLWRWSAVLEWAIKQQVIDGSTLARAKLIEDINSVLETRNSSAYSYRTELYNKLDISACKH